MALKVTDEYIKGMGSYLQKEYDLIENFIAEYYNIMSEVAKNGIAEGTTHDALREFINQVWADSKQKDSSAASIGVKYSRLCSNYVMDLDEADGNLY